MDLKPSPALKSRYRLLAILIFVICVFSWSIPLALFIPLDYQAIYHLSVHLPTAVALVYTLWWIPRFYGTLSYEIDEERGLVTSRSGVFWKSERRVNIPKVNMVHTTEGPLQRHYGTKHLHIHTAAMGAPTAEVIFFDLEVDEAEKTRDELWKLVEAFGEMEKAAKEGEERGREDELGAIRKILEEIRDQLKT